MQVRTFPPNRDRTGFVTRLRFGCSSIVLGGIAKSHRLARGKAPLVGVVDGDSPVPSEWVCGAGGRTRWSVRVVGDGDPVVEDVAGDVQDGGVCGERGGAQVGQGLRDSDVELGGDHAGGLGDSGAAEQRGEGVGAR